VNNLSNCPNCGQPAQPDDKFCRNCGIPFKDRAPESEIYSETPPMPPTPPLPPPPPPPTMDSSSLPPPDDKHVPWEEREKYGFFGALWETWKESIVNPDRFFANLPYKGGMGSPILYAVIIGLIFATFRAIYGFFIQSLTLPILSHIMDKYGDSNFFHFSPFLTFLSIPLSPIYVVIGLFIASGIYHLIGKIFGWASRDFEATLRAIAYASGPYAFVVIPFCGNMVAPIWSMILMMIAYKHLQNTTTGKAVVVILLPLLLCCCLAGLLAIFFGAALLSVITGAAASGNWDSF
jgi:hypothetical protein